MKRTIIKALLQAVIILMVYAILLRLLAGTNIIAGVFCPGPHLPKHYPILIFLFVLCRLYVVLLPGFVLSRIGLEWMKRRQAKRLIKERDSLP